MTKEWFIEKNGKWHGPFSSERLKALVAQNKLQANDKVRKGKDGKVVPAGKLKGLFGDPKHDAKSVPSPPPLSLEAAQSTSPPPLPTSVANETQHLASDLESPSANNDGDVLEQGNAVLTKLKSGASRFAANSKAAAQLLAIQANRQQIVRNLLPKSYQHLGEAIYGARTFADNLTDLYSELDKAQVNLLELKKVKPVAGDQTLSAKAKATALSARDAVVAKSLSLKVSSLLARLGKDAFEKHGANSGSIELVKEIATHHKRIEELDAAIRELTESHSGQWITPKRIAIGSASFVGALLVWSLFGTEIAGYLGSDPEPVRQMVSLQNTDTNFEEYSSAFRPSDISGVVDNVMDDYLKRHNEGQEEDKLHAEKARQKSDAKQHEYKKRVADEQRRDEQEIQEKAELYRTQVLYAKQVFGSISLTPDVSLSSSLKAKGVTIEIRGKNYLEIVNCIREEDWQGLTLLLSPDEIGFDRGLRFDFGEVDRFAKKLANTDFQILVRTKQSISSICCVSFPNFSDLVHSPMHGEAHDLGQKLPASQLKLTRYFGLELSKHPDGIGYLGNWKPNDGPKIIFDANDMKSAVEEDVRALTKEYGRSRPGSAGLWTESWVMNAVDRHLRRLDSDLGDKINPFKVRYRLGEIKRDQLFAAMQKERDTVWQSISKWVGAEVEAVAEDNDGFVKPLARNDFGATVVVKPQLSRGLKERGCTVESIGINKEMLLLKCDVKNHQLFVFRFPVLSRESEPQIGIYPKISCESGLESHPDGIGYFTSQQPYLGIIVSEFDMPEPVATRPTFTTDPSYVKWHTATDDYLYGKNGADMSTLMKATYNRGCYIHNQQTISHKTLQDQQEYQCKKYQLGEISRDEYYDLMEASVKQEYDRLLEWARK